MNLQQKKTLLLKTSGFLIEFINGRLYGDTYSTRLLELIEKAPIKNPFFTINEVTRAIQSIAFALNEKDIDEWFLNYKDDMEKVVNPKKIGVIMAGNIPFVGWHDMISVIVSGNDFIGKPSSDDADLMPFLADLMMEFEPSLNGRIHFTERLNNIDAVIATGSNNSARYFDYYFGKYPHIIRKNRNAVAVINGFETAEDFKELGNDIFQYFGLGCRNVSKLYVPKDYDFNLFFESIEGLHPIINHHKYANNYDYNRTILLMKQVPFLDNNFMILNEDKSLSSPISVLNYERYENTDKLKEIINNQKDAIQCIASLNGYYPESINFGTTQQPKLWDYADGVDTLKFLFELNL
jgi:hypothetical protein